MRSRGWRKGDPPPNATQPSWDQPQAPAPGHAHAQVAERCIPLSLTGPDAPHVTAVPSPSNYLLSLCPDCLSQDGLLGTPKLLLAGQIPVCLPPWKGLTPAPQEVGGAQPLPQFNLSAPSSVLDPKHLSLCICLLLQPQADPCTPGISKCSLVTGHEMLIALLGWPVPLRHNTLKRHQGVKQPSAWEYQDTRGLIVACSYRLGAG